MYFQDQLLAIANVQGGVADVDIVVLVIVVVVIVVIAVAVLLPLLLGRRV